MAIHEKTTAPIPPVSADGEQPLSQNCNYSIADDPGKSNDIGFMETFTMKELYEMVFESKPPIIDGLLYPGTYLFAGAPKVGKSFLMAQLAYHVSVGLKLWDYKVSKSTVLYLALEDDAKRLQKRLFRMFDTDSTEHLHFSIAAKQLNYGLEEQLQKFVGEHPDTKLVMIDTLQKIRKAGGEKFSYGTDYEMISKLKQFAGHSQLCLLLVHHTRKQQADDRFDMISGTNGLLGAADGAFLLQKEKRTGNSATLDISGRDQQDQRLYLTRDLDRLSWQFERAETELWKESPDPILDAVAVLVSASRPMWTGTPTELVEALGLDIKANTLTLRLNVKVERLLDEHNVRYENMRSHIGRCITLTLIR